MTCATLTVEVELARACGTDYYLLEDLLTDAERDVRDRVRAFVDTEVTPVINGYWDKAEFPFALIPKIARLAIIGTTIEGYGCPGLSRLAAGLVTREVSRGDGSVNTFIGVHSGLAMGTIHLLGSDEQKQRWLPAMARLDSVGAFALTEPKHGSDSVALETTARRDGHEPDGYSAEVITGKIGKRAVWQADVVLGDVRVPLDNKIEGADSFRDASRVLTSTRGGAAWESLGHAIAAYEVALVYARQREQFGKPIASFQLVQNKLANMLAEITSMQLFCFRMAQLQEQGQMTGPMASLAKMNHAQKARQICMDARDILGGNGLLLDYHVARHMTDMEVVHTYEGTDSIQSLIVGRDVTGISAFA